MIDKPLPTKHKHSQVNLEVAAPGSGPEKKSGGRPRKYAEPSQPITITLPRTTLRQLEDIDSDRGRAIVKLAQNAAWDTGSGRPLVEIVEFAGNTGLVVVGPNEILKRVPFLRLVEVAPARFLLALSPGHDFHELEIALTDFLDDLPVENSADRELVSTLVNHFKNFRRSESITTAKIVLVRLDSNR